MASVLELLKNLEKIVDEDNEHVAEVLKNYIYTAVEKERENEIVQSQIG